MTEVGLNQHLLTSQTFFPLFLKCLTFAISSGKPSCTWGNILFLHPKVHLWSYPLPYLFPLLTLLWIDLHPSISPLSDAGDCQIPLWPSFWAADFYSQVYINLYQLPCLISLFQTMAYYPPLEVRLTTIEFSSFPLLSLIVIKSFLSFFCSVSNI